MLHFVWCTEMYHIGGAGSALELPFVFGSKMGCQMRLHGLCPDIFWLDVDIAPVRPDVFLGLNDQLSSLQGLASHERIGRGLTGRLTVSLGIDLRISVGVSWSCYART
jgi:hypothetical protein